MYINKEATVKWITPQFSDPSVIPEILNEIEQVLAILHKHDPSLNVETFLGLTDGDCNVNEFYALFSKDAKNPQDCWDDMIDAVRNEIGDGLESAIDCAARWDCLLTAMLLDKPERIFGGVSAKPYVDEYKRYKATQL